MEQTPIIYMDNAATTRVKDEVIQALLPCYNEVYYNPSSIYSQSRRAKALMDIAREQVAKALNCLTDEVYFTGGGSEADNYAIKGVAFKLRAKGNHIITCVTEHKAVLDACKHVEKLGGLVTYLPVKSDGLIDLAELEAAMTEKTILVSIMYGNNEIGTIQRIKEIGQIAHQKNIVFHTDAVQAIGNIKIDVQKMNIDMKGFHYFCFRGRGSSRK